MMPIKQPFPFTLQTLILSCVVVAASLGIFEEYGYIVALGLLFLAAFLRLRWYRALKKIGIIEWTLIIILILFLIGLLLPAVESAREAGRRATSMNNMKNVCLAVLGYESENGNYPFPFIADSNDQPLFSWRVSILLRLEREDIYQRFDRAKPWNGNENQGLSNLQLRILNSPLNILHRDQPITSYVAVVGPETMWPTNKTISSKDIADGLENTLMLIELRNSDIPWAEPRDITFDEFNKLLKNDPDKRLYAGARFERPGFFYKEIFHANYALVSLADGSQKYLSEPFMKKYGEAMCTRAGGENIDWDDPCNDFAIQTVYELDWGRICGAIVLAAAELLLIFRPIKKESIE